MKVDTGIERFRNVHGEHGTADSALRIPHSEFPNRSGRPSQQNQTQQNETRGRPFWLRPLAALSYRGNKWTRSSIPRWRGHSRSAVDGQLVRFRRLPAALLNREAPPPITRWPNRWRPNHTTESHRGSHARGTGPFTPLPYLVLDHLAFVKLLNGGSLDFRVVKE
jgi:hypothetical protein